MATGNHPVAAPPRDGRRSYNHGEQRGGGLGCTVRGRWRKKGRGPSSATAAEAHPETDGGGGEAYGGPTAEESTTRWPSVLVGNGDGGGDLGRLGSIPFDGMERATRRF
jgi:hypothetical protein